MMVEFVAWSVLVDLLALLSEDCVTGVVSIHDKHSDRRADDGDLVHAIGEAALHKLPILKARIVEPLKVVVELLIRNLIGVAGKRDIRVRARGERADGTD